jgi:hypothetical protein
MNSAIIQIPVANAIEAARKGADFSQEQGLEQRSPMILVNRVGDVVISNVMQPIFNNSWESPMKKSAITTLVLCGVLFLGGVCPAPVWAVATASSALDKDSGKPSKITSIKGTCTFSGKENPWSAKLTPKGDGTYDAIYISTWSGKPLNYVGTIKTDLKSEISGSGKASGGGANGTFEFSGKYGNDGIAQCSYKEVNGRRKGTMTAEMPK